MVQRFYAFATARNHANLPPILTLAKPTDWVVWLETETAQAGGWSRRSSEVLERRGLRVDRIWIREEDVYAPNWMRDLLLKDIKRASDQQPFFVLTGGQKHSVLGFDRAATARGVPLVYSELPHAQLRVLQPQDQKFDKRRLENCLLLQDLLHDRGLQLLPNTSPRCVWPNGDQDGLDVAGFGRFRDKTEKTFQARQLATNETEAGRKEFGAWFEGAVAHRIASFLSQSADPYPVTQVWQNACVSRIENPGVKFAEYDVLILMANAAVLHIEAKTGEIDEKDNFARVAKLTALGGDGATQILCGPLFTELPSKVVTKCHRRRLRAERWKIRFLPYTADGQTSDYYAVNQKQQRVQHRAASFEEELNKLLAPYRPRN
jgi:hypothetical protein